MLGLTESGKLIGTPTVRRRVIAKVGLREGVSRIGG